MLHLEVHYGVDIASEPEPTRVLASALVDLGFGSAARVLEYERDRSAVEVDLRDPASVQRVVVDKGCARGPVFAALQADSPPKHPRRFGSVMLRGKLPRTWVGIHFDEYRPAMPMGDKWLFSNSLSVNTEAARIATVPSHEFLRALLLRLVGIDHVLWGAVWNDEEFRASNLHDETDGMRALGRDVRRALPGLYWLNAFGFSYVELIGQDVLASVPASVLEVGSSVIVQTYPAPGDWANSSGRDARERVLTHIGRQYFFDRAAPDRPTVTVDFGLPELQPRGQALSVFTADGKTFTVLDQ